MLIVMMNESTEPAEKDVRSTQEWANERFNPGDRPSDAVIVDETADEAPSIGHPE